METNTTSAFMVSVSPIARFHGQRDAALAVLAPVTLVFILKFRPCFSGCAALFRDFAVHARQDTSRNSTTVTSAPKRRQTEPNSKPITPAPMTPWISAPSASQAHRSSDDLLFVDRRRRARVVIPTPWQS